MYPWSDCEHGPPIMRVGGPALASSLVPPYELSHGRLSLRERQLISTRVLTCYHLGRIGILGGCKLEVAHAYQRVVQIPVYADGRVRLGLPDFAACRHNGGTVGLAVARVDGPPLAASFQRRDNPHGRPLGALQRRDAQRRGELPAARLWEHRRRPALSRRPPSFGRAGKTLRDISERCSRERQRLYQEFPKGRSTHFPPTSAKRLS